MDEHTSEMQQRYTVLMDAARKTNAERDAIDRVRGYAAPTDAPPLAQLLTAMSAIEAGIRTNDWASVTEGQAMLEELRDFMDRVQG